MAQEKLIEDIEKAVSWVCGESGDVVAAYLYGSVARGEEREGSDLDIALLFEHNGYGIHRLLELARKIDSQIDTDREIDVRALNGKDVVFQKSVLSDSFLMFEGDAGERMDFERRVFRRYLDMKPHIKHYYDMRSERIGA
jgi:predicted nucleotidyltransferase